MDPMKKMMDTSIIPGDAFEFDEEKNTTTVKEFFSRYKKQFPMMAIITMGYYGDTPFDCYDTWQVFRIHGITSQPRVVAVDEREAKLQRHEYLSIPVDTPVQFRVVKSHKTVGEIQDLKTILEDNKLPVLVQTACNKKYRIRVGTEWKTPDQYGNLLITKKFEEQFMMIHCLYGRNLQINDFTNLMAITPELTVCPITGFKAEFGGDFDAYMRRLAKDIEEDMKKPEKIRNKMYDMQKGNPDWGYCYMETKSLATGSGGETPVYAPLIPFEEVFGDTGPPPALPPRQGRGQPKTQEEDGDIYEEIDSNYTLDENNSDTTTKAKAHSSKKVSKKEKSSSSKRSVKVSEKHFKHLEESIKQKKGTFKRADSHDTKSLKSSKDAIDTKQDDKAKVNIEAPPTNDDGTSKEERYVKLARSEQGTGYMEVVHKADDSQAYEIPRVGKPLPSLPLKETNDIFSKDAVAKMTIEELGENLKALKLEKYVKAFEDSMVDGAIVQELTTEDFMTEFKFSRLEALRLAKFASTGHIPK